MKKFISFFAVFFLCNIIYAQQQLTLPMAVAYNNLCTNSELHGHWLEILGEKYYGQEYANAIKNNDDFKIHKFNKEISDKYEDAKKLVKINPVYYVTELIEDYSYDFTDAGVNIFFKSTGNNKADYLDLYEEGNLYPCAYMYHNLHCTDNPEFRISNVDNIPKLFEMPVDIAEKSFAQRKGNNRPVFKLRYYFKFWQCDTKLGEYNNSYDVEVVKVELIDDIVNYKKSYDVAPGEQPENANTNTSSSNNESTTKNNSSESNQQTNSYKKSDYLGHYDSRYSDGEYKTMDGVLYYKSNSAQITSVTFDVNGVIQNTNITNLTFQGSHSKNQFLTANISIAGFTKINGNYNYDVSTYTTYEGEEYEKKEGMNWDYQSDPLVVKFAYNTPSLNAGATHSHTFYINFLFKDTHSDAIIQGFFKYTLTP